MSMWGMDDGSTLTGKHLWTNGDATVQDGGTGPNATYVTDGVEAGDVLVGFDGLLYRVVSVTSETALEVDRNYEGGTADSKDITKIKLPRHLKITKDDGTGHSLQTLGVFGITKGEADAGVDNLSAIGLSGTSSIGRAFQSGTAHRSVPTVTVAAPPETVKSERLLYVYVTLSVVIVNSVPAEYVAFAQPAKVSVPLVFVPRSALDKLFIF